MRGRWGGWILGTAELVVTAIALGDLFRRPATLVRGQQGALGAVPLSQPVGSPLYLLVGRRGGPSTT